MDEGKIITGEKKVNGCYEKGEKDEVSRRKEKKGARRPERIS